MSHIKAIRVHLSRHEEDSTVRVVEVRIDVFSTAVVPPYVLDAADHVDADVGGLGLGLPAARHFLILDGLGLEVSRNLRERIVILPR